MEGLSERERGKDPSFPSLTGVAKAEDEFGVPERRRRDDYVLPNLPLNIPLLSSRIFPKITPGVPKYPFSLWSGGLWN